MLVLTRNEGQNLMIETKEGLVTVKVLSVDGGQIKLGVDAPRSLPVNREEIYDRKQKEKRR